MNKLIIENEMELLCLHDILKQYPGLIINEGYNMSATTSKIRIELLEKIENILSLNPKSKGKQ